MRLHATLKSAEAPPRDAPFEAPPPLAGFVLGRYRQHPRDWSAREVGFALIIVITLMYLALYHPYWVRGGDSELYLAIARHLVRGEGYRYNGQPVALVPPGWPLMLAGGMWLTSSIAILKLILLGSMLVFFICAFHVLRRYAAPWSAAAAVLAVAICQPTWQLSMWFLAEAPFLAASWLALLLTIKARDRFEAGPGGLRFWSPMAAALLLLAAAVSMRWTGALWGVMLALALVEGVRWRASQPRRGAVWAAASLCVIVGFASFLLLRQWLETDASLLDPRYGAFEAGEYDLINQTEAPTAATYFQRLLAVPQWISVLFWTLLARARSVHEAMSFIALLALLLMSAGGAVGVKRRQWLWLGVVVVWLPIILNWPSAIARYTLPVAPLICLAAILGAQELIRLLSRPLAGRGQLVLIATAASIALCAAAWRLAGYASALLAGERASLMVGAISALALLVFLIITLARSLSNRTEIRFRLPWVLRMTPLWLIAPAAVMLVAYNLGVLGLEAWGARDPVNRFEAGSQRQLTAIGYFLRGIPADTGEVAVANVRAYNGVRYATMGPRRKVVWLADRNAIDVLPPLAHEPRTSLGAHDDLDADLVTWLRQRNVRWYVTTMMQGRLINLSWPAPSSGDDWRIYEIAPHEVRLLKLGDDPDEVLIVPGLEDVSRVAGGRARLPLPYN